MPKTLVILALGLAACATYETVRDADGEVYECDVDGETVELCYYADSARELAELTGARSCGLTGRWWPLLTNALGKGCRYVCPGMKGCNATGGCFCDGGTDG